MLRALGTSRSDSVLSDLDGVLFIFARFRDALSALNFRVGRQLESRREPNAPPKKTRGPGAVSAALAAAAPAAAPPPPSPSPPPLPTEPLPFPTYVEHDGEWWTWWKTAASGGAQCSTAGAWARGYFTFTK